MPKLKIHEPDKRIKSFSFPIEQETIDFGRKRSNDVILSDPSVSIIHAQLQRVKGGFILEDMESTNGCTFEDEIYTKIDVIEDISFQIGDVPIDILFSDEELQELEEEGEFESQEFPKFPSKKKKKKKKKPVVEKLDDEEDDYEDDAESYSGGNTFVVAVIAFLITIGVALAVLFFTGNL